MVALVLTALTTSAFAQGGGNITGTVKDKSGNPIIGAAVTIPNTARGTSTDIDGRYTIKASAKESLNFSYIGYQSQLIQINNRTTIDVVLTEDNTSLEEVVVVGYGVQKKRDIVGAVEQISSKDIADRIGSYQNVSRSLQGAIPGLTVTIPLTVISFTFALIIAVIMALVQFANVKVLKQIARFYIWIFRGTPLLVQLFVVFFGLSRVGILLDPFPAAVIVFSLNEGAYCAETIRAALESVPKGQLEAGQCVGLTYLQTIFRIVLPQAMRTAFPPLSNSLISMVKDTSLAANITVTEMFMVTQRIVARTYDPLLLYLEVGLIYLIFSTVLTWVQRFGEKKLASYGHKEG